MRATIKLKITLWFTFFMVALLAVAFFSIAIMSTSTTAQQTQKALIALVDKNAEEVEYDDGEIEIDDDFVATRNGVSCLVLDNARGTIFGYLPYAELAEAPLEDGALRTVSAGGETFFIYDKQVSSRSQGGLWIRGAVPENAEVASAAVVSATLLALPLLIILAAVGGYILAGHSLRPIKDISQTARDIGSSGDLSKRIALLAGKDELHQLSETFNQMFARLEKNFEAERNFTSDASHELRTPVATILAQCEYAFEHASSEVELYEALGAIQTQGYRISHLISSLLQFTRMEQQTEAIAFQRLDISRLSLSICQEQQVLEVKGISLESDIAPGIHMNADSMLFTRLLENLISNAYRYGKENGSIFVRLRQETSSITLSVADDGIGISPQDLPNIWNRFYRADKSRSGANGGGLGLGLAMVKEIALRHNGTVSAESRPGTGSTFTIIFRL